MELKIGDLVKYIPYGHEEPEEDIGIIVYIDDDGYYEVHFCDDGLMCDLVFSELALVCK